MVGPSSAEGVGALGDGASAAGGVGEPASLLGLFEGYVAIFVVAFGVTVLATPIMRALAVSNGVVDRPLEARKAHRAPVAYLGGIAVFLGLIAAFAFAFVAPMLPGWLFSPHASAFHELDLEASTMIPPSILLGVAVITFVGLWDDVFGLDPRWKVAGQLFAAAALAMENVGVKVAAGVLAPVGAMLDNPELVWSVPLPGVLPVVGDALTIDVMYWTGTAIIAVFVLGACNASNLIDGLDGLLSGVTAIATAALLVLALLMAQADDGPRDAVRIILCLSLLGATLGFLPHNFNPATIFLGDCGSLLLGYMTIVIILTLGDTGATHLVIAGLIIYSIPIIDTVLAIVRRKLSGRPMSAPDDQHLHHMLKRALGVKGAVFVLYGIGLAFGALGVWLAFGRVRVVLTVALVFAAYIGVTAVKVARKQAIERAALGTAAAPIGDPTSPPVAEQQKEAERAEPEGRAEAAGV